MRPDLIYCFPSRATRRRWLRHGTLLNLRYVANKILKKQDEEVVTWGFDDTTKAAGVHLLDVKTSNITIDGDDRKRETYTTGFTPNLSHSGLDQAATLKHSLQMLAVLAGKDMSVDDLIEQIDFWMSDRAADCDVLLDTLGVDEDKRLKCCQHVILTIDEAINKVFIETESMIWKRSTCWHFHWHQSIPVNIKYCHIGVDCHC